jgi:hypothetical protein
MEGFAADGGCQLEFMMIKRKNCLLIVFDYFNEARFDCLPVHGYGVGVRYVSEFHETASSMWRRVDGLWTAFREQPEIPDLGMCFLLKNYADQALLSGLSDRGCPLGLNPFTLFNQWFHVPVADDGTRVIFRVPEEMEFSRQTLHSRANVEKVVDHWLEYDHIPSYIPEDYLFPWEFGRVQPAS